MSDRLRIEGHPERLRELGWIAGATGIPLDPSVRRFMSPDYLEGYDAGRTARIADRKAREDARERRRVGEE